MRAKLYMLATVAAVAVPALAFAEVPNPFGGAMHAMQGSEFYVGAAGGWNNLLNSDIEGTGINKKAKFNDGWAALGTVGYRAPSGFRGELELGYRTNEVDSVSGTPATTGSSRGDVNAWTIMGNVLYDFVNKTPLTPYVGVGLGAAAIHYDNVQTIGTGAGYRIEDTTWAPAAQGIVGVNYQVRDNIGVFANYQYLTAFSNPRVKTSTGVKTDIDYDAHTVLAGVRVAFGAPKPAPVAPAPEPAPEPTPAPQQPAEASPVAPLSYMVFFDFDKATITPEARAILETAVQNAKGNNVVRIDVTGHADRAGSDAYNMRLSQRRADAVKKELVRLGLAVDEITTAAKGETEPLVATDDGVREPQNRRVEIVYTQGAKQQ